MPRKPRTRPRGSPARVSGFPGPPASRSRANQTFWQCQACGGLVDPMYGRGEESWCPHCHTAGQVYGMDGQIPDPLRYGEWVRRQEEAARGKQNEKELQQWLSSPNTQKGDLDMKWKKPHTGTFHCPACFIEYDVTAEASLKCDECGGPLAEGSLDNVWADDDDGPQGDDD